MESISWFFIILLDHQLCEILGIAGCLLAQVTSAIFIAYLPLLSVSILLEPTPDHLKSEQGDNLFTLAARRWPKPNPSM
jgi:hypothetical protein